jgi:hypothetical protein
MGLAELSLEQAPPISVPLRFFLTAPLFALLAAGVLGFAGPDAFLSRWTPATLAATHLLTLGFLAMCMIGALTQMLPVLAGAVLRQPRTTAWLTHLPLTLGTLLLAGGLVLGARASLAAALPLLAWALLAFTVIASVALWRSAARNATIVAMKLALLALGVVALLGVLLGFALSGHAALPLARMVDMHAAWGLLGWIGLLSLGVAYQVVPMFQLTNAYPPALLRLLAPVLLAALLAWSAGHWFGQEGLLGAGTLGLAGAFAAFAAMTLRLQQQRRRHVVDVTLRLWRLAMLSMIAAIAVWGFAQVAPAAAAAPSYPLALGVLWIAGFALSAVSGMLYKIVPFLVWLHLQSSHPPRGSVPNMKEIIPDAAARTQAWAHEAGLLLLLSAALKPAWFLHVAAAMNGLAALLLAWNLHRAWRIYLHHAP